MSIVLRIIGVIIALAGVSSMYATMYGSSETIESGLPVPTATNFMKSITAFGGTVVMFIGFGIIAFGFKICKRSSD